MDKLCFISLTIRNFHGRFLSLHHKKANDCLESFKDVYRFYKVIKTVSQNELCGISHFIH